MKTFVVWVVCLVGFALILSACSGGGAGTVAPQGQQVSGDQAARDQQIAAGKSSYAGSCASCHGQEMGGGSGPALTASTISKYKDAKSLYDYTAKRMPTFSPGSLTEEQYLNIVAYMLNPIGVLPADQALTQDNLSTIQIKKE
jgi:mono/diheme cytochrome c family protein